MNELWHYDMEVGAALMGLPLRRCNAKPVPWPTEQFPAMDAPEFEDLKKQILDMWTTAAQHFVCKEGPHGWGLFIRAASSIENLRYILCCVCMTSCISHGHSW